MNKFYKTIFVFIYAGLLTIITGCAQYETIYTPPYSEAGVQCINQCATNNQICQSNCEMAKSRDRMTNATERQTAAKYNTYIPQYVTVSGDCNCQVQYEQCYTRCGGDVRKVCVSGCD
jgi:hypothetical protein